MLRRQMQISRGGLQIAMTELHLNSPQIGAAFQ
jgi:hypothetical protein